MGLLLRAEGGEGVGVMDEAEVRRFLTLLSDPQQHIQLQALKSGVWINLPAREVDAALSWLASHNHAQGLYATLNPLPALDRPARNPDPLCRRWFLVDLDPCRPQKADANSTDTEHAAAGEVALAILDDLCDRGWPLPVQIDSGNGWHLLWRIDLPNSYHTDYRQDASAILLKECLKVLKREYGSDAVEVDGSVYDAKRITKIPGTWARKGPHSPQRPHRLARLVAVPDALEVVTRQQLEALAQRQPAEPEPAVAATNRAGLVLRAYAGGADVEARAVRYLTRCAPAISGEKGHNKCLWAARILVWGFNLNRERSLRLLESHYNPTCQPPWSEKELAHKVEQADTVPFPRPRGWLLGTPAPAHNGPATVTMPANKGEEQPWRWEVLIDGEVVAEGSPDEVLAQTDEEEDYPQRRVRTFSLTTLGTLMKTEFPPPVWAIPGILSEGLNILAGAPKLGKSILSLNVALTLAGGGRALGNVQVDPSDVLYLSLEDKQRRVKTRSLKMLRVIKPDLADDLAKRLTIVTDWPRLDEGGLRLIELWRRRAERPRLVIIDVWNRFAPPARMGGSSYSHDAESMGELKRYLERHEGLTGMVVHHTRKPGVVKEPEDYVQEVSGTMGLSGTADGILVLLRSRSENQASLHVTGRDVSEQELVLEFDAESLTWKNLGTAEQHMQGRVQQAIIRYLRSLGEGSAFVGDIAQAIGEKENSVRQALNRMRQERVVRKVGNAWSWPGDGIDETAF